ncbi:MAG TPA: hypothetical protein VGY54_27190 [Polyangiaceae bacterium]|nr:hypothetical protein [Polyangiaceae bacterium]
MPGPSGSGPVRGSGAAYQAAYDVSPEGPGAYQLNMHPAPNSGVFAYFRYSPCPRELEIDFASAFFGSSVLVPIP